MPENYEQLIGPIKPDYVKPISLDLQKSIRQIDQMRERNTAWVDFTIRHYSLQPEAISELLQLTPSEVNRNGDTLYKKEPYHLVSDCTRWTLSSKGHVADSSIDEHLNWMLQQLYGKLPSLRHLQKGGQCSLRANIRSWSRTLSPAFEVETFQQLARLRIPLRFIITYENTEADY